MTRLEPKPGSEFWPLDKFKPDVRELARHSDPEIIRQRGLDMLANGQLQAVGATEDGRMIFGHGRLLAARSAGIKALEVKVFPASLPETQFHLIRAAENFQRTDLSAYQKWLIASELMCANPSWDQKNLVEHMHLSESTVSRILAPSKCTPAWQDALKAGTVGLSDCVAASKLPLAEQDGLLAFKLATGATRDQIERAGRKARTPQPEGAPVKLARVKCQITAATVVTVAGPEMTLEGFIDTLTAVLSAARAANKDSLDVKTFEKVLKDKAKAAASP